MLNIYERKFQSSIKFCAPRQLHRLGQHLWAGWPTRWRLGFYSYRDYFIVTRNLTAVYLDLVPFRSFIVTLGFASTYRDWQKTSRRDIDGT
jgi:hypothetical protein